MAYRVYEIDGNEFWTLEQFYDHFQSRVLGPVDWGRNLDALSDVLSGGFGTPDEGFVLHWVNHQVSRERLGYDETVRQLQLQRQHCHTTAIPQIEAELDRARYGSGPTVFDWLVDILKTREAWSSRGAFELILK